MQFPDVTLNVADLLGGPNAVFKEKEKRSDVWCTAYFRLCHQNSKPFESYGLSPLQHTVRLCKSLHILYTFFLDSPLTLRQFNSLLSITGLFSHSISVYVTLVFSVFTNASFVSCWVFVWKVQTEINDFVA